MLPFLHRFCLAVALVACLTTAIAGQIKPNQRKTEQPTTKTEQTPAEPQDVETLKIDTNLVMVPVVASDRNGIYISDLRQDEFSISENGVKQEVAFFGTLAAPFHVVLMLDTSASTQEKLRVIQNAAFAFVEQLKPADRVKVISFDDQVRDLNEFTSNRETLRSAINSTRSGEGTRVYDAVQLALDTIRKIQGRKAIVIFTDGVDWHSLESSFQSTVRGLDEEGVIVYPIRYDTRDETERIAREQSDQMGPQLPTIDVIRRTPGGTTPQTFPSEESIPTSGTRPTTGPMGIPLPEEILRRKRESDRRNDPRNPNDPTAPFPGTSPSRLPDPTTTTNGRRTRGGDDSISSMLNMAYATADKYLETLAQKSGGRLLRADNLVSLPEAFAKIAAELRTQYLLGYYPLNKERDESYRKIVISTSRKDVVVRSRPGYIATAAH